MTYSQAPIGVWEKHFSLISCHSASGKYHLRRQKSAFQWKTLANNDCTLWWTLYFYKLCFWKKIQWKIQFQVHCFFLQARELEQKWSRKPRPSCKEGTAHVEIYDAQQVGLVKWWDKSMNLHAKFLVFAPHYLILGSVCCRFFSILRGFSFINFLLSSEHHLFQIARG